MVSLHVRFAYHNIGSHASRAATDNLDSVLHLQPIDISVAPPAPLRIKWVIFFTFLRASPFLIRCLFTCIVWRVRFLLMVQDTKGASLKFLVHSNVLQVQELNHFVWARYGEAAKRTVCTIFCSLLSPQKIKSCAWRAKTTLRLCPLCAARVYTTA